MQYLAETILPQQKQHNISMNIVDAAFCTLCIVANIRLGDETL